MSGYPAGTQLLLQELGRPGADALQDQLVVRDLDVRGFQQLQQRLSVIEMALNRTMETGLAAELGQPICTTLCVQFGVITIRMRGILTWRQQRLSLTG